MTGSDADGLVIPAIDDGIGLDVLGHTPGKQQISNFICGRLARSYDLEIITADYMNISVLYQQAAIDPLVIQISWTLDTELAATQNPDIFLRRGDLQRLLRYSWRDDYFSELLIHDPLRCFCVQFPVEGDDAAKCRGGIGLKCQFISAQRGLGNGDATGIGMFYDDTGWVCK